MTAYVGRRREETRAARLRGWTSLLLALLCALVVVSIPVALVTAQR